MSLSETMKLCICSFTLRCVIYLTVTMTLSIANKLNYNKIVLCIYKLFMLFIPDYNQSIYLYLITINQCICLKYSKFYTK